MATVKQWLIATMKPDKGYRDTGVHEWQKRKPAALFGWNGFMSSEAESKRQEFNGILKETEEIKLFIHSPNTLFTLLFYT